MLTGFSPQTSRSDRYDTAFDNLIVDPAIMGGNSPFRQPWANWDPNGMHNNANTSPERAIWDNIGSLLYPEVLANAESVLNGFKSRMWRGINGIAESRWNVNQWDDTSPNQPGQPGGVERANEALSELRLFPAVFSYLNDGGINGNLVTVATRIDAVFAEFDDAVIRNGLNNNGATVSTSILWREYFHNVVIRRLEDTQLQYRNLLWRMLNNWQNALLLANSATTPDETYIAQINEILVDLRDLLFFDPIQTLNPDDFTLNTAGLFPNPTS